MQTYVQSILSIVYRNSLRSLHRAAVCPPKLQAVVPAQPATDGWEQYTVQLI